MPNDTFIPAPAHWDRLRPTDQPVLPAMHGALRNIEGGYYSLCRFSRGGIITSSRFMCVVDDHGELVPLGPELEHRRWVVWSCSEDFEAAGTAWWEAKMAEARAQAIRDGAARATRALLRPAPVRAELTHEPADHPTCAAAIRIGPDERMHDAAAHTVQYRIDCDHQSITLTHAQLAALMLAGQQLCARAHRPAEAALQ